MRSLTASEWLVRCWGDSFTTLYLCWGWDRKGRIHLRFAVLARASSNHHRRFSGWAIWIISERYRTKLGVCFYLLVSHVPEQSEIRNYLHYQRQEPLLFCRQWQELAWRFVTLSQPAGSDKTWKLACDHLQAGKAMDSKVFGYSSGYKGDRDR